MRNLLNISNHNAQRRGSFVPSWDQLFVIGYLSANHMRG